MKLQDALATIDDMIWEIEAAQASTRDRSTCSDREYYEEMDAEHAAEIDKYRTMRDAIENGLE